MDRIILILLAFAFSNVRDCPGQAPPIFDDLSVLRYPDGLDGRILLIGSGSTPNTGAIIALKLKEKRIEFLHEFLAPEGLTNCMISEDGTVLTGICSTDAVSAKNDAVFYIDFAGRKQKTFVLGGKASGLVLPLGEFVFVCINEYEQVLSRLPWEEEETTRTMEGSRSVPFRINIDTGRRERIINSIDGPDGANYRLFAKCSRDKNTIVYSRSGVNFLTGKYEQGYYNYSTSNGELSRLHFPCFDLAFDGRFIVEEPPNSLSAIIESDNRDEYLSSPSLYSGKRQTLIRLTQTVFGWNSLLGLSPCGRYYVFSRRSRHKEIIKLLDLGDLETFGILKITFQKNEDGPALKYLGWIR